jgi:hypothetical protein
MNRTHIFEQPIDSEQYTSGILQNFFDSVMEDEMMYSYVMQECDTAKTANYSDNVLHEVLKTD